MKKRTLFLLLFVAIIIAIIRFFNQKEETPLRYISQSGAIFSTSYHITYEGTRSLQPEVDSVLRLFDASLSPFNKNSIITRVNSGDSSVVADEWFRTVFLRSQQIYLLTGGTFDPTVSPLINAWGFGFREGTVPIDSALVDSLLPLVGFEKITLTPKGKVEKGDARMTLNFSAIAKGYASDVIGNYLAQQGVTNYLVEIGGEVVAKGVNQKGKCWRIGVTRPVVGAAADDSDLEVVVPLCNRAMATSGNYRNFYERDGKRYAHTIDPKSGYPIEHNLLSATVLADDCMTADAVATACMVLGVEESLALSQRMPGIDLLLIYTDETGNHALATTPGMEALIASASEN